MAIVPLIVHIPGGAPTGRINDTTAFLLPGTTTAARFIFVSEDGDLSAWNGGVSATRVGRSDGAIYKGLALVHSPAGPPLLAANFHDNRVDVFDGTFAPVAVHRDVQDRPCLPATRRSTSPRSTIKSSSPTPSRTRNARTTSPARRRLRRRLHESGALVKRLATHGVLNSPWGMTIAPANFGSSPATSWSATSATAASTPSTRHRRAARHPSGHVRQADRHRRPVGTDHR